MPIQPMIDDLQILIVQNMISRHQWHYNEIWSCQVFNLLYYVKFFHPTLHCSIIVNLPSAQSSQRKSILLITRHYIGGIMIYKF